MKTAIDAMTTQMFKQDYRSGNDRSLSNATLTL